MAETELALFSRWNLCENKTDLRASLAEVVKATGKPQIEMLKDSVRPGVIFQIRDAFFLGAFCETGD